MAVGSKGGFIVSGLVNRGGDIKITFDNTRGLVTGTLLNTGHSPELEIADSNRASLTGGPLGDKTFELLQFHVHFGCVNERGSEHKLDGKQLSGEVSDNNDVNLFSFTFDSGIQAESFES